MQINVPDNGGYMVAAYVIVAVLVLGYAVSLVRRARKALR
jgi:CcmD family protein